MAWSQEMTLFAALPGSKDGFRFIDSVDALSFWVYSVKKPKGF